MRLPVFLLACLGFVCHGRRIPPKAGGIAHSAKRSNPSFDTDGSSLLQADKANTSAHVSSHSGLDPLKILSLLLLAANPADAFNADALRSLPAFRGLGALGHSRASGTAQSLAALPLGLFKDEQGDPLSAEQFTKFFGQNREALMKRARQVSLRSPDITMGGWADADAGDEEDEALNDFGLADLKDEKEMSQSARKQAFATMATTDRVQRLKNMRTDRLILNVLTSCEFALRLEVSGESSAKIDFPNLLRRIKSSIDILQLRYNGQTGDEDVLMGRLHTASEQLAKCMDNGDCDLGPAEAAPQEAASDGIPQGTVPRTAAEDDAVVWDLIPTPNFVVREDGTVDYDELLASSREVARFGVELWERLNGRDQEEELPDIRDLLKEKPVKSEEVTAEVQRLQAQKNRALDVLDHMLERGVQIRKQLRLTKEMETYLASVGRTGRSITKDMVMLRMIDKKVGELRRLEALCEFNLDIERMCVYLEKDMQESPADSLELKLVVAEVNLVERQLMSVMGGLGTEELEEIMGDKDVTTSNPFLFAVDDEELGLIRSNIEDLKTRLGIAGSVAAPIDYGTAGEALNNLLTKTKGGLDKSGLGIQMLGSDLQYTGKLFLKALNGKTLVPREVNAIRRSARDLATLVPFLIIGIIPITPVGHLLVFGFISQNFPELVPSFFTDKRQNFRQLYSDVLTKDEAALIGPAPKQQSRLGMLVKGNRDASKVQSPDKTDVDS